MLKKKSEPVPQNNNNHMSQHEVADELGITRRQVASIETKAIRKIKNYLKKNRIKREDLI